MRRAGAERGDRRRFRGAEEILQIVDIIAVISLFGFLNRFNDTMATELEAAPIEAGKRYLRERGWTVGKHAA